MLNKSIPQDQFEWPEYDSDKDRIKAYTEKYKKYTIAEAFEDVYGHIYGPLKDSTQSDINNIENNNIKVNNEIRFTIEKTINGSIYFNGGLAFKYNIICINNYNTWPCIINMKPGDYILAQGIIVKIQQKSQQTYIYIDILKSFLNIWLNKRLNTLYYNCIEKNGNFDIIYNLQQIDNGYTCKVYIDSISKFIGKDYYIDAFIPGSQIALNIEYDFAKWNDTNIYGYIINYINTNNKINIICSRKAYLKYLGNCQLKNWFNIWCDNKNEWDILKNTIFNGIVTGVINSTEKCGVFIELPEYYITGMISIPQEELTKYHPNDNIQVLLDKFDENIYYDKEYEQIKHKIPYEIVTDTQGYRYLLDCQLKPIFKLK